MVVLAYFWGRNFYFEWQRCFSSSAVFFQSEGKIFRLFDVSTDPLGPVPYIGYNIYLVFIYFGARNYFQTVIFLFFFSLNRVFEIFSGVESCCFVFIGLLMRRLNK